MRRLLTAFGVDYDQWRALTITALKLDFRQTALSGAFWVRPEIAGDARCFFDTERLYLTRSDCDQDRPN